MTSYIIGVPGVAHITNADGTTSLVPGIPVSGTVATGFGSCAAAVVDLRQRDRLQVFDMRSQVLRAFRALNVPKTGVGNEVIHLRRISRAADGE